MHVLTQCQCTYDRGMGGDTGGGTGGGMGGGMGGGSAVPRLSFMTTGRAQRPMATERPQGEPHLSFRSCQDLDPTMMVVHSHARHPQLGVVKQQGLRRPQLPPLAIRPAAPAQARGRMAAGDMRIRLSTTLQTRRVGGAKRRRRGTIVRLEIKRERRHPWLHG